MSVQTVYYNVLMNPLTGYSLYYRRTIVNLSFTLFFLLLYLFVNKSVLKRKDENVETLYFCSLSLKINQIFPVK